MGKAGAEGKLVKKKSKQLTEYLKVAGIQTQPFVLPKTVLYSDWRL